MSDKKLSLEDLAKSVVLDDEWEKWWEDNKSQKDVHKTIFKELKNSCENGAGLEERLDATMTIRYGHILAYKLAKNGLKYSQLRRFFDALKEIEYLPQKERAAKLTLFQIHLIHGQARKEYLKPLVHVLNGIISNKWVRSNNDKDFQRFLDLIDSVVAYFKLFEPSVK